MSARNRARSSGSGSAIGRGKGQWLSGVPQLRSGEFLELSDIGQILVSTCKALEANQLLLSEYQDFDSKEIDFLEEILVPLEAPVEARELRISA